MYGRLIGCVGLRRKAEIGHTDHPLGEGCVFVRFVGAMLKHEWINRRIEGMAPVIVRSTP